MSAPLYAALFDDAAIFPPGNVPMGEAVRAHLESLDSPAAPYIGPFVCSDARLGELQSVLGDSAIQLALTTTADHYPAAVHTVLSDARFTLRSVEIAMHDVVLPVAELPPTTVTYIELPWGAQPDLPPGTALKLRTGGETTDAFPTEDQLAHALGYCVGQDIRFKLTAGLHNAIRHTDPVTGFEHHGFLNVLLATRASLDGASTIEVAALLDQSQRTVVTNLLDEAGPDLLVSVRRWFTSFGSCSVLDPLGDLIDLGLLPGAVSGDIG